MIDIGAISSALSQLQPTNAQVRQMQQDGLDAFDQAIKAAQSSSSWWDSLIGASTVASASSATLQHDRDKLAEWVIDGAAGDPFPSTLWDSFSTDYKQALIDMNSVDEGIATQLANTIPAAVVATVKQAADTVGGGVVSGLQGLQSLSSTIAKELAVVVAIGLVVYILVVRATK